jgi:hypothetical protein
LTIKRITRHPEVGNSETTRIKRKGGVENWSQTNMDYLSNYAFVVEIGLDYKEMKKS